MGAKSHGWKRLAEDLGAARERVVEDGKKIVGKGCLHIKKQSQQIIRDRSKRGYLPHYPRAIGYDVTAHAADIIGEVGPDANKLQGGLGRIIEFGSVNSAPIPHLIPSLDDEVPRFVGHVQELGERLLNGEKGPDGPVADPGGG
ncbi:hypothetical protein Drose_04160 [Dactylosporangium roseum]|uniref:HK97 gp10 family phage protein n=1 Tax=Dactylosporangium roseum TaxID=47989 RepID=A0ABY5Z8Y9_9ACTN|nr:hypothetical protein [Dactylosporangium roseum]UWZ37483.1 hypothetical protein Drose_04160 [Dactylosporangium roseum]